MNKAFKVIWNHATQSWTAVSEIARSKGKTKSVKTAKTALAAAVAVAAATAGTSAHAAMAVGGTGAAAGTTGNGVVTVVNGRAATAGTATVTGSTKGMAIGEGASVSFNHPNTGLQNNASSIAMGYNAAVNDADRAVVIGGEALASGANAVVIGTNATAIKAENTSANGLVVIGNDALIRNVNMTGTQRPQNGQSRGSTAIGANSLAGLLTDAGAAIGDPVSLTSADYNTQTGGFTPGILMYRAGITDETGATVGTLQANEATAIGFDARAIGDQSIAIGAQVVAGHSSVALGGNDMQVAANSTNKGIFKSIAGADLANNTMSTATGNFYETTYAKDGSVAIGQKAHSNELFGTAIGTSAFVEAGAELGTAIGAGARVGKQTLVAGDANVTSTADFTTKGGVAIAAGAVAERDYTTAIGTGSKANQTSATAMGYQALASGVNATAVGAKAVASAADALAYGGNATSYATNAVAVGTNSTVVAGADSSIAFGTDTSVSGAKTVALGSNIKNVSTAGSVVLGDSSTGVVGAVGASHAVGTVPDAVITSNNGATITYGGFKGQPKDAGKYVSIGAVGAERQLKNVAAGNIDANSTDGINGSQLYSIAVTLGDQVFQSTYFHVNNVTNNGTGNSTTNLGNITDAAGAAGYYAVTAGVNTTATSNYSTAIGYQATAGFMPDEAKGMSEQAEAIAIGKNATAEAAQSIAIGTNATISVRTDKPSVYALPTRAISIGAESSAHGLNSVALGPDALAGANFTVGANTIAIGNSSSALSQSAIAMGYNANAAGEISVAIGSGASTARSSDGSEAVAIGSVANASRIQATALGAKARANGANSLAMGAISHAASTSSIAMGTWTQAEGTSAQAIGHRSAAYSDRAMAEGHRAVAVNVNASASGVRSVAAGTGSIAIGTNAASGATRADADAIIAANDAYTLAMYRDYIAQINLAADPTNATTIAEAEKTAATLETTRKAVDDALAAARAAAKPDTVAIGTNTTVLGQDSAAIGYTNTIETTANGTYVLGSNITATKDNNVILGQNSSEDSATTTKGTANQVVNATVANVTYGNFAGTAKGIVSVGAKGAERQIINVAPGEISATSTDAINGSQLYAVAASPITFKANTLADTGTDGSQQQLGSTIAIIGSKTAQALKEDTTNASTAGAYSAKNIQTVVTDGQIQIQMAENPVFNSTTIGGSYTDADGNTVTTNPIVIGTDSNGNNTISNLTTTLPEPSTVNDGKSGTLPNNITTTNAATLGDVLNAGWNLQENGAARDLVTPYNTVNFANGTGTVVNITSDGNVSTVKINVDTSKLTGDIVNNANGTVSNGTTNPGSGLANISTVVDAINKSGWNVTSGNVSTGVVSGTSKELINPGETVTFIAGDNMVLKQDGNNFTYSVSPNPVFNSTTIGGSYTDADGNNVTTSPIVIGTVNGNNTISNLTTTLPDVVTTNITNPNGTTTPFTDSVTRPVIPASSLTNAATLGDVLNAGWNLQENGSARDFVKPYDTVNFKNGNGTTVVSNSDGNVSNIQYDVNVDGTTTEITYVNKDGKTVYLQPDGTYNTQKDGKGTTVAADDITGSQISAITSPITVNNVTVNSPVNLVDGNTTTVSSDDKGNIKVEVKTGDSAVNNSGLATPYTDKAGNPVTKNADGTYTDAAGNPIAAGDVIDGSNQVATVGDIVNTINGTGWNLRENGTPKDLVTASNVVNFVHGQGTTANITTNKDGTISNVTYNVNVDNKTTTITYVNKDGKTVYLQPDGTYNTQKDGKGTTVAAGDITSQISAIAPTTQVNGGDVTGPVNLIDGDTTTVTNTGSGIKVEVNTGTSGVTDGGQATVTYTDKDGNPVTKNADGTYTDAAGNTVAAGDVVSSGNKVATVGDIVNTINSVYHSVNSTTVAGTNGESTYTVTDASKINAGDTVNYNAGQNIKISGSGDTIEIATTENVTFKTMNATTVNVGDANTPNNTPLTTVAGTSLASDGKTVVEKDQDPNTGNGTGYALSVGGNQITNVANGAISPSSTDAINGSQLYALQDVFNQQIGGINNRIDDLEDESRAGIAGTAAMINIPQVTRPGANLVGVGLGHHKGESALAVGFSSASDNERLIFKMSGSANTQGDFTIGTGMGWQW